MNNFNPITNMYLVEEIKADSNQLVLVNYFSNKKINAVISDEEIEIYTKKFDEIAENDGLFFVEVDEERGVILG